MRDRIVQIVALLLAGTFIVLGGGLLPTIVEKAGQDHLLVGVVDPETRELRSGGNCAAVGSACLFVWRTG